MPYGSPEGGGAVSYERGTPVVSPRVRDGSQCFSRTVSRCLKGSPTSALNVRITTVQKCAVVLTRARIQARGLFYHSILGLRVAKKKKKACLHLVLVFDHRPKSCGPEFHLRSIKKSTKELDIRLPGKGSSKSHGARLVQ